MFVGNFSFFFCFLFGKAIIVNGFYCMKYFVIPSLFVLLETLIIKVWLSLQIITNHHVSSFHVQTNSVFVLLVHYFPQSFSCFFSFLSSFVQLFYFSLFILPYYSSLSTQSVSPFYLLFQISQIINLLINLAEINFSFLSFYFLTLLIAEKFNL